MADLPKTLISHIREWRINSVQEGLEAIESLPCFSHFDSESADLIFGEELEYPPIESDRFGDFMLWVFGRLDSDQNWNDLMRDEVRMFVFDSPLQGDGDTKQE